MPLGFLSAVAKNGDDHLPRRVGYSGGDMRKPFLGIFALLALAGCAGTGASEGSPFAGSYRGVAALRHGQSPDPGDYTGRPTSGNVRSSGRFTFLATHPVEKDGKTFIATESFTGDIGEVGNVANATLVEFTDEPGTAPSEPRLLNGAAEFSGDTLIVRLTDGSVAAGVSYTFTLNDR